MSDGLFLAPKMIYLKSFLPFLTLEKKIDGVKKFLMFFTTNLRELVTIPSSRSGSGEHTEPYVRVT